MSSGGAAEGDDLTRRIDDLIGRIDVLAESSEKIGEPPVEMVLAFGYVPKEPGVGPTAMPPEIVVPSDLAELWGRAPGRGRRR